MIGDAAGQRYEVVVGQVAHGGHFVARVPVGSTAASRVVFVRHALPDERVVIEITEGVEGDRYWRADVVEVLEPSPDRVAPPCPLAHPGGCGGCDFQHVALPVQRELKAAVVREQLQRLAGIEWDVEVEEVLPTLRWRTRMRYVALPGGGRGLRKHRSHDVVTVDDCLIAAPDAREPARGSVTESVLDRTFRVAADGFWQSHTEAPRVLVEAVLSFLEPRAGERAADLYAGVGLLSAFLAEAVGPSGAVLSVERDGRACQHARANLADQSNTEVRQGDVRRVLQRVEGGADLVVLDPPRTGAKRGVVAAVADLGPRAVAYVACDPAALARDLAYFRDSGYALTDLRAFDLYPMTHHVECVALLRPVT